MKQIIVSLSGDNVQNKFYSVQSRLVHLHSRVMRMPLSILTAEQKTVKSALLIDVLATLDSLDEACKSDPELSRLMSFRGNNESVDGEDSSSQLHIGDHDAPEQNFLQSSFHKGPISAKFQSIEKWNVKFTGELKVMSVHNFLERVAELCVARHVSERQLFDSAVDLFSGKALSWFRANKGRFNDWQTLTVLLRRHFEPPDYRPRLFREILERTQDPSEGIIEYLSCMQALFRRYGGLAETAQLDILTRNLAPFYSTQLPVVDTQLEEECLKLEVKKYRVDNYVPPSRKKQQFVEPDFAFVSTGTTQQIDSDCLDSPSEAFNPLEIRQTGPSKKVNC